MGMSAPRRMPWARLDEAGQMSVEMAVAMPAILAVALVALNAMLFMGECASFDRLAYEAVRTCAASPAYGTGAQSAAGSVQAQLAASFAHDFESVDVQVEGASPGYLTYTATLEFRPMLFGKAIDAGAFGMRMPTVQHRVRVVIDSYKTGGLL